MIVQFVEDEVDDEVWQYTAVESVSFQSKLLEWWYHVVYISCAFGYVLNIICNDDHSWQSSITTSISLRRLFVYGSYLLSLILSLAPTFYNNSATCMWLHKHLFYCSNQAFKRVREFKTKYFRGGPNFHGKCSRDQYSKIILRNKLPCSNHSLDESGIFLTAAGNFDASRSSFHCMEIDYSCNQCKILAWQVV